jgi:hypothetical protein
VTRRCDREACARGGGCCVCKGGVLRYCVCVVWLYPMQQDQRQASVHAFLFLIGPPDTSGAGSFRGCLAHCAQPASCTWQQWVPVNPATRFDTGRQLRSHCEAQLFQPRCTGLLGVCMQCWPLLCQLKAATFPPQVTQRLTADAHCKLLNYYLCCGASQARLQN